MRNIKAFCIGMGLALALALVGPAAAQGLPEDPILRIETGMHGALLRRIDTDAAGRLLISASEDGTARLWDAATGEAIRTLRLPLGPAVEDGRAFAAALSPDGRIAAVGGWARHGEDSDSVFLFDTQTGRMLRRIPGFGNVIFHLAFSADGRFLAAGGGGTSGVTVLETAGWTRAAVLGGYGGNVLGLDWDAAGRLATVSYDGRLRLYDADLTLSASVALGPGAEPYSVAFSPDGRELALGFGDSARVEVRDADTLKLLRAPAVADVAAPMFAVAWSADGQRLMAGGRAWTRVAGRELRTLRVWPGAGRGAPVDWPVARDAIIDLAALPGGDVLVGGMAPELARLAPDGALRWGLAPALPNWRARDTSHLRLAPDGRGVGMTPLYEDPLRFDPVARRLEAAAAPADWPAARDAGGAMRITDWHANPDPKLNGRPLGLLRPFERALSVTVAPAGDFAVLGADYSLYGLARDGALRWRVPVPGAAWAVNLAQDGRSVVAALGDGTIRWYRAGDGAELLALFVHADRTRWVIWTPSGYFDAAPGGEDLIGWHVNRGLDQAPDFFPAHVFRDRFYRPDVVALILDTLDEGAALAQADAARGRGAPQAVAPLAEVLPPVLRIRAPERDSPVAGDSVRLELDVSTPADAPLTEVSARVNGRLVPEARKEGSALTLPLPAIADAELFVSLQPANRHGFGPTVDLRLRRDEPAAAPSARVRPKLHVLAIGVSDYADDSLNLSYAAKDARDIAALFAAQTGPLYREVEVRLLTDAEATFAGVRAGLGWLRREMTDIDTALIFVAGHGVNDNNGDLFFLTHETELDEIYETAVEATMFTDTIQRLPGRVIYMMDTCHSGNLEFVRRGAARVDLNRHLQDLRAATGAVVFSSAMGSQYALESPLWGNGAFTLAVLEGLAGQANIDDDGVVTVSELHAWVSTRVKALTDGAQTPVLRLPDEVRDFPLAMPALAAQVRP